jgi:hypothetical protein
MGSTINPDYALSATHKEMLEKSLLDSDPEVAEIMVRSCPSTPPNTHPREAVHGTIMRI